MEKTGRGLFIVSLLIALGFYAYIAFCVPYCHDDWDWGLDVGMRQWLGATLNSRYAGSFFVVAMTRSQLFKTLTIAVSMLLTPLLMTRLSGHGGSGAMLLLANVLMLIVPQLMWQQTYGWVSSFANFVVPVPLLLFLIMIMERSVKNVRSSYWLCLPLAVILCLFSENLSVYALFACFAFTVFHAVKNRKLNGFHGAMTAACVLGCVIVFSSPIYKELISSGSALNGIRRLTAGPDLSISATLSAWGGRFFRILLPSVFFHGPIAPACASLALIFAVLKRRASGSVIMLCLVTVALNICVLLNMKTGILIWALPCGLYLCMFLLTVLGTQDFGRRLFFLLSVPAVILPLAVVDELGPRLFFLPYVFFMTLTMCALPKIGAGDKERTAYAAAFLTFGLCAAFYSGIYADIRSVTREREQSIASAVERGEDRVYMKKDPNRYWWGRNPVSEERAEYFKEFYGIPEDMEVVFE